MRVWIDPAVPPALLDPVLSVIVVGEGTYALTDEPEAATIRVEPQPERPLTHWVYAVVAAFPTVTDGVSLEVLHQRWGGEGGMVLSPATAALLERGFGTAPGTTVMQVGAGALIEAAWDHRSYLSIVPFEQLEPRWKVLELESQSPVRKAFDPETYPLLIPFGLSGDAEAVEAFARLLDWPVTNRDPEHMTVLVVTGVTALTRATAWRMEERGLLYPAEAVGDWLRDADITHISNEVSFTETCPVPDPVLAGLRFCSRPEYFALLQSIGVDVVELTGNHNLDYGPEPFIDSLDLYDSEGWVTFGGGADLSDALKPGLIEHNGNRLAFIGCNKPGPRTDWASESQPGATPCDEPALLEQTSQLRTDGYLPVFTFQWFESAALLEPHQEAFRQAARAGAVIVSGSQAHRPMAMAFDEGAFIHYGLGNLFFDQMQSLENRQEFIDRHIIYEGKHISTELLTALLEDYARPRPMDPEERSLFLVAMFEQSGW